MQQNWSDTTQLIKVDYPMLYMRKHGVQIVSLVVITNPCGSILPNCLGAQVVLQFVPNLPYGNDLYF